MIQIVKIVGVSKLTKKLKKEVSLSDVKKIIRSNGAALKQRMKRKTDAAFTKGYATGQTKRSIQNELSDGGLTATVEPTTKYAAYVEFGTRYMEAEPFVRPAFHEQMKEFERDMKQLEK